MRTEQIIPLLDLTTAHQELEEELVAVFRAALKTARFAGGPVVEAFERVFAAFCHAEHCVGVANGTDALRFALIAAGIKPGDTVVTVPNTFIATTEAISQAGGRFDFVDIDKRTYTMDPAKLRAYFERECTRELATGRLVSKRTGSPVTALIPVHLYGQMADMDPLMDLAEQYDLIVIEDACQAHGAEYFSKRENRWRTAGSMGRAAAFSFYPAKNLGACGEAGAVTTNDEAIARRVSMLRDHGQSQKYYHDVEGYNGRIDAIQAGILSVKLQYVTRWNEERRQSREAYDELLAPMAANVTVPYCPSWSKPVCHVYVIRTAYRNELQKHLSDVGIGTGIHYPIPIHLQAAYGSVGWKRGDFPVSEEAADEILSLPMFPGLHVEEQRRVVEAIAEFAFVCSARESPGT
jgi:dTDP-4-amino-4,6-dideoxygalactose transaminase